jgi:hypothetical protein
MDILLALCLPLLLRFWDGLDADDGDYRGSMTMFVKGAEDLQYSRLASQ